MTRPKTSTLLLALPFLLAALPSSALADDESILFAEDGAWCWFSDPPAIALDGRLYAGWIAQDGSVIVGSRSIDDLAGPLAIANLAPQFERDNHNHPALPDQRIAAFFAPHASGDLHLRTTLAPRNLDTWSPDRELGFSSFGGGPRGVTYANPFLLAAENQALYLFWRATHFKPAFAVSNDQGQTWGPARTLIAAKGSDDGVRPYLKFWSNGHDQIDFLFTDGHPRNEPNNSVYFLRYAQGRFTKADGSFVGTLADLPFEPAQCDLVYDGASAGRSWVWSLSQGPDGHPIALYTRLPSEDDHRYHYARWDGTAWIDDEITPAGAWLPDTTPGQTESEPPLIRRRRP